MYNKHRVTFPGFELYSMILLHEQAKQSESEVECEKSTTIAERRQKAD